MKSILIAAVIAVMCLSAVISGEPPAAAQPNEPYQAVEQFTGHFLKSFENLDLDEFMSCFSDDATAFFPTPESPDRFDGKAAIRARFAQAFAAIRQNSIASHPPYHLLPAKRLSITILSKDSALVTFELQDSERIARRTLVLVRTKGGWLINHLHASNVAVHS